eukprot:m51a1_g1790 putative pre-mrna-splicing factor cwc22 homolog (614) ;mRNA; f:389118-391668
MSTERPAAPSTSADAAASKVAAGLYIPPSKLAALRAQVADKTSAEYQRLSWDALKKSLNGLVNKVSATNIRNIAPELFRENLHRGRGLLCRSLIKAQNASPNFTAVYASLVAVVNTKVPAVGELLLHRLIDQFRKSYRRNFKPSLISSTTFLAHLLNQQVCTEVLGLELLALLLERPTEDSVEVAVEFVTECGFTLQEQSPRGFNVVFESFRNILHEGKIDLRVQYMIEELFTLRKRAFAGHAGVPPELDLVEEEDQVVHDVALDMDLELHDELNFFKFDDKYAENEEAWKQARIEILGDDDEENAEGEDGADDEEGEEGDEGEGDEAAAAAASTATGGTQLISDQTATDLINLKKTIYLTIMSSLDFEECAHKLLKMKFPQGQEMELCKMIIECCCQERTYLRFYGLLAERFCRLDRNYQDLYQECFLQQYSMIHHLETNKLRNVAKFFAHLFHSDAMPWESMQFIHLNEQETTSSSRIFIKILFQEIAEYMGLAKLNTRLKEPTLQPFFAGLFPRDNPRNTRFSINFFTSIGLGGLTDDLREHLKNAPKQIMQQKGEVSSSSDDDSSELSSSTESSSSSSLSSSSSSTSSSSSSESDSKHKKRSHKRQHSK